ncbi:MAG: APC family permease [Cyclobacteriaceae bacterium]
MASGKYPVSVAITLVIANMVGTGVFTSLGFQVGPVPSAPAILILWFVGGVVALCGALCYAEIAVALNRSGGEYHYLSELYHPALGFISGWTSLLVGFAGAVSAVALAIGEYSSGLLNIHPKITAVISIFIVTVIHLAGVKAGGRAQNIFTGFKLSLILFFCLVPFFLDQPASGTRFIPVWQDLSVIASPGWAVSLVFVVYAYSGWNASSYIAGSLENPEKNLPKSLITGTIVVLFIYLALNCMFMYFSEFNELNGKSDIGNVVAFKFFGEKAGTVFSGIFSFALLSTLSAMTIAGPRVGEAMGEDYKILGFLVRKNRFGMPWIAVVFQSAWSMFLVLTSSFKEIIQYVSVSLSWFTLFTVLGVFLLRKKQLKGSAGSFSIPLYPLPPLIFVSVTAWMIIYLTISNPAVIYYSLGTVFAGGVAYLVVSSRKGS